MGDQEDRDKRLLTEMSRRRNFRIPMYAGLVLSGMFVTYEPPYFLFEDAPRSLWLVWALAMMLSAAIALYGAVTDKWIGEFTGLPLLVCVLGLLGLGAIMSHEAGLILLAYGVSMISFSCGLLARWNDVRNVKNCNSRGDAGKEV